MSIKTQKTITHGSGGWRVEVYTDDDGASGYGDNARRGYWYGSREECEAIDPNMVILHSAFTSDSPDPFDITCERKFD